MTDTPANNVLLALPLLPLLGSKTTKTMVLRPPPLHAGSFASSGVSCSTSPGNDVTLLHVTAPSSLFHRPLLRVPRNRMRPSLGSTAMRSPLPRPASLPPNLMGTLVRWNVRPWSEERRMAPSGTSGAVYVPHAR